jgi:DNA-binding CsgD family transcriptional regulator
MAGTGEADRVVRGAQHEIVCAADELWRAVHSATAARRSDTGLTRVAVGTQQLRRALCSVTRQAQRSIWHLAAELPFEPWAGGLADASSRAGRRGITWQVITNAASLSSNPVLRTEFPAVRIAPVRFDAMVLDAQLALSAGAPTPDGEPTWWVVHEHTLRRRLLELWRLTAGAAASPSAAPVLSSRQVRTARMVAAGEADCAIAKALGVSPRTVAQDVSTVLKHLGARTRPAAVAMLCGRALVS